MALTVNLSVLFLCLVGLTEGVIANCTKQTACSCLTETGVTMDLSPLAMTGGAKTCTVTLQCSQSEEGTLIAKGAIPAGPTYKSFDMVLRSKYACVDGHNTTPGGNSTPGGNTTPGGGGIAASVSVSVLGTLFVIVKLLT